MLLKSLELQGFKTFPEKTKLSFDQGITVIVGPNGSGKSNISDAIRWVLGEQSVKNLRCLKMEDVIFNGSLNKKPKGFAEVILTIDNTDRRLPFDEDDVSISRRFYRSSESEYLINGETVRLKDIHELFMDTGLGRDGYSVISQGKIDSIVSLKSNERREIFEEAAGISKYRYRKTEAEAKLLKAEENLLRLNDILKELEDRIGPLFEQSQKAHEYVVLVERLKSIQIGIWLSTLEEYDLNFKKQENDFLIVNNHYNEIEKEIQSIVEETEKVLLKVRDNTLNIDSKKNSIKKFEEDSLKKSSEISVLKNDILHNNETVKRLELDVENISNSFSSIDSKISKTQSRVEKLTLDYDEIYIEIEDYKNKLEKLKADLGIFGDTKNEESAKLKLLNEEKASQNVMIMTIDANLNDLKNRDLEVSESIKKYKKDLENIEKENIDIKNKYDNVIKHIKDQSDSADILKEKLENNQKMSDILKKEVDKLNLDYEEKIRKLRFLEEVERNLDGFSQSVKVIIKESQKGNLKGIHGPVSNLINVPCEYALAIETALGAVTQNIVVDSEQSAKFAISFLKEKKSGRATFLPISNIKGKEFFEKSALNEVGAINLASKLCSCDQRYGEILSNLLGRVLIVDNIDNAIFISKKYFYKFKVVTLDGQVINAGGSMTGGSKIKNLGLLNRNKDIEEMRALLERLKEDLKLAKLKFKDKLEEQESLKDNLCREEGLLNNLNNKKVNLDSSLKNNNFKLASLKSILADQIKLKEDLSFKKTELVKQKEVLLKKLDEIKIKLENLEKNINDLDLKKDSLSIKQEEYNKKLYEKNLSLISLQKDIENEKQRLKEIKDQKVNEKDRAENIEKEISSLNSKNKSIEEKIEIITGEISNLKDLTNDYYSQIDKLTAERMDNEKRSTELRNLERTKTLEKEKISLEVARVQDKKDSWQKNYDEIIAKLWDNYEFTRREAMSLFEKVENNASSTREINEIKLKIKSLGVVNVAAIEEYEEVSKRYEFLKTQINDVEKSKEGLYKLIKDLTLKMKDLFSERFNKINVNFNEVFKDLFSGGKAEIKLSDPDDVLNSGIEIFVQPPGKIVTHLESLSGGERAFISIALYFAIIKVNPVPFCVLDEIEAALDEVNVAKFAAYLRKINKNTQFIAVSHRRGTMEQADILYGVTMQDEGISKLLELKVSEYEKDFIKEVK